MIMEGKMIKGIEQATNDRDNSEARSADDGGKGDDVDVEKGQVLNRSVDTPQKENRVNEKTPLLERKV